MLETPAVLDQLDGEPIEQIGIRRSLALHAKIVGRRDNTAAKVLLPESIDDDASGQWMIGSREPIGQLCATTCRRLLAVDALEWLGLGRGHPEEFGEAGRQFGFRPVPTAAFE